ncbi:MAG: hypothetical protein HY514_05090 [Candidatus Aenigmarchaeota archaeon]|nr:hypothetical protein [Candidatus Aenigmarchaeota archaeon]
MFKRKSEESLLSREREMVRMISSLSNADLRFIIVGGYAVATFMHRFSVDLDVVMAKSDIKIFEDILSDNNYSLKYSKELALIYGEEFKRFEKLVNALPVNVDLLINGLVSRTTGASWSFDYILKDSRNSRLDGVEFLVPSKELLVAMKIHAGRFADIRDIVALIEDCDIEGIKKKALRGNKEKLKSVLNSGLQFLYSPSFPDSFKGVFGLQFYKEESTKKVQELLEGTIEML